MKKPTIKLLGERVLLKLDPIEEKTKGGVYIPLASEEKPVIGVVVATGPGTKDVQVTVKEGDRVRYAKHCGQEIELEGEKYHLITESDILLVLPKKEVSLENSNSTVEGEFSYSIK